MTYFPTVLFQQAYSTAANKQKKAQMTAKYCAEKGVAGVHAAANHICIRVKAGREPVCVAPLAVSMMSRLHFRRRK